MIKSKELWIGILAGFLIACFVHPQLMRQVTGRNIMGNAGGFTGGNPGVPEGPGFYR